MIGLQILYGTILVVASVIFHISCLVMFGGFVRKFNAKRQYDRSNAGAIILLSLTVLVMIVVHTIEMAAWALLYVLIGEFSQFSQALYFSVVTATTLGYGDRVLTESWQLLGTFEAIGGLLLFGASTAGLFQVMLHILPNPFEPDKEMLNNKR